MAEDVLGVFPASEIWGLNRKRRCTLLLSDQRLLVVAREAAHRLPRPDRGPAQEAALAAYQDAARFDLPLEEVRWVQIYPSLLGAQLKIQTPGGAYRFALGRRHCRELETELRDTLDLKVRRPGQYD